MDFDVALRQQLTDRQRRKDEKSNVERLWTPKQIQNAFLETFEMVGGVPRLAIWASREENYEAFLKMLITLAPKGAAALLGEKQGNVIEYRSNVPASPLNRPRPEEIEDGDYSRAGADSSADMGHVQTSGRGGEYDDLDGSVPNLCGDEDLA